MTLKKHSKWETLWYAFVFLFLYIWFAYIHPLVVYDSDDWCFVTFIRRAFPVYGSWNPARVLPEILMPAVSGAAVHLLYPFTGDYLGAITAGSAFVVSLFITVYICCFTKLVKRSFSLSEEVTVFVSAVFFLFHFLAMRSEQSANQYMFYCWDLTCYYFYLIPSLLNASLVMFLSRNEAFDQFWCSRDNQFKKGIFLLVVYLAIFSNLPSSGILAAYAGSRILFCVFDLIAKKCSLKALLRSNTLYIGILLGWFVSAFFELTGGRAGMGSGAAGSLSESVRSIVETLSHPTHYASKSFLAVSFLILAAAAALWFFAGRKDSQSIPFLSQFAGYLVCGAALLVYMIILMAVVDWTCVYRSEYLFGLFFYLFLLILLCLCYLLCKCPNALLAAPVVFCILLSCVNTTGQTFKEANMRNIDSELCVQVGNDLIQQIVSAVENGEASMNLYVPVSDKDLNWPFFTGENAFAIVDALYEHGVIGRHIDFTSIASMEINNKYHLGLRH